MAFVHLSDSVLHGPAVFFASKGGEIEQIGLFRDGILTGFAVHMRPLPRTIYFGQVITYFMRRISCNIINNICLLLQVDEDGEMTGDSICAIAPPFKPDGNVVCGRFRRGLARRVGFVAAQEVTLDLALSWPRLKVGETCEEGNCFPQFDPTALELDDNAQDKRLDKRMLKLRGRRGSREATLDAQAVWLHFRAANYSADVFASDSQRRIHAQSLFKSERRFQQTERDNPALFCELLAAVDAVSPVGLRHNLALIAHPGSGGRWACQMMAAVSAFANAPLEIVDALEKVPIVHTHHQSAGNYKRPFKGVRE